MGRNKLRRFQENIDNDKVIQEGKEIFEHIKGQWYPKVFVDQLPITLEVGCGRGEYTVGLARKFKEKNFIGADIKGSRIWKGASLSKQENLTNTAFLRTKIELIERFFESGEVDEIWITFPDPRPLEGDEKRRLTSPRFLSEYRKILKKNGVVHLKTDSIGLFEYTQQVLDGQNITPLIVTKDLYNSDYLKECHDIQTTYEKKFMAEGFKINYLRFELS